MARRYKSRVDRGRQLPERDPCRPAAGTTGGQGAALPTNPKPQNIRLIISTTTQVSISDNGPPTRHISRGV